jgi:hypothetical protein
VHALEDHRRTVGELFEDSPGVHHPRRLSASSPGRLGVTTRRKGLTILHQPKGGQAQTHRRDDQIDIVQGEKVLESPAVGPTVGRSLPPQLLGEALRVSDGTRQGRPAVEISCEDRD